MIPADLLAIATERQPQVGSRIRRYSAPTVYFLIVDDEVVYVGYTTHPRTRIGNHKRSLGRRIDRVLYLPVDEEQGFVIEMDWIKRLCPRHNKMGNPNPTPWAENWSVIIRRPVIAHPCA